MTLSSIKKRTLRESQPFKCGGLMPQSGLWFPPPMSSLLSRGAAFLAGAKEVVKGPVTDDESTGVTRSRTIEHRPFVKVRQLARVLGAGDKPQARVLHPNG